MTSPQPDPPGAQDGGPPQGGSDSDRIRALEQHQSVIDGKLDRVLGLLEADGKAPVTGSPPPPVPAPDIAEQMRQAVRDVAAEQAKAGPQAPAPEQPPREIGVRGKARLQRGLFGGDR